MTGYWTTPRPFPRAFGVSVRASIAAIEAGEELERLAQAHHEKNPHLTSEQASAEVLNTPKGGELYATATRAPRAKPRPSRPTPGTCIWHGQR